MSILLPGLLFLAVCALLLLGYPVAFSLAGTALLFAGGGYLAGIFDLSFLNVLPNRVFGVMTNTTLAAVPLFILMGIMLERAKIAEELLAHLERIAGGIPGGLAIAVIGCGALMAASTGIVGATVVTMGLLSLPTMLERGYNKPLAAGTICATGTLGQIIPPSIALVLLGDILSSAYQQAQLRQGSYSLETVSVGDLFIGALLPGLLLVLLYTLYVSLYAFLKPRAAPAVAHHPSAGEWGRVARGLLPPLLLIVAVLGSILLGVATPTEAAGVGAMGATLLALLKGQLGLRRLRDVLEATLRTTAMVFLLLLGATLFSLVFRGFGGEEAIHQLFDLLPGGTLGAMLLVMAFLFLLGFILDFIEITFMVVPIIAPVLLGMGVNPVWLGVMIAMNLQTSFLTPPFGFALFYLRGVAPPQLSTADIYRGALPFTLIQLLALVLLACLPQLATWLPRVVYGS